MSDPCEYCPPNAMKHGPYVVNDALCCWDCLTRMTRGEALEMALAGHKVKLDGRVARKAVRPQPARAQVARREAS
ncbi:MAG: hypothetical protein M3O87_06380 [Candidatus Dormibacteraeota bacterium]|nr:hypothetical protein [Candidatus Dormibacteraeota bacterium]